VAVPINAPLPPDLDLGPGWSIQVTALSTADGSTDTGVTVQDLRITLNEGSTDGQGGVTFGPFMLVPGPNA